METLTTEGIAISVSHKYAEAHSNPHVLRFFFSYQIRIENKNTFSVQLMSRCWQIYDSNGTASVVEGEGVVGQQPILAPGEVHIYESGCNFSTEIGKMKGKYFMEKLSDGTTFQVVIPEFTMVAPCRLN